MITRTTPDSWRDLQTQVARVLTECGFEAEVEKTIDTVRGAVEVDVFAQEDVAGRRYSIICECKHWKATRIPQTVVHAFRTVIADTGTNVGYIVSLRGFQRGSYSASELTNVELVTWHQFLEKFETSWYDSFFAEEVDKRLSPLMTYSEPFVAVWFPELSPSAQDKYLALKRQYDLFGMLMQSFGPWRRMLEKDVELAALPLIDRLIPGPMLDTIPHDILVETQSPPTERHPGLAPRWAPIPIDARRNAGQTRDVDDYKADESPPAR